MGSGHFGGRSFIAGMVCASALLLTVQPAQAGKSIEIGLRNVASGLTAPVSGVAAPGDAGHLYVVDQIGKVVKVELASGAKSTFLDVQHLLVPLGLPILGGYDERGLLGLAFHPDFAANGLFYTFTTEPPGAADFPSTPVDHDNVIREWRAGAPGMSRVVLRVANPQFNHTGGTIAFGPDRMLYIALGDGGGEDDQDCQIGVDGTVTLGHGPRGTGQDPGSILASILRIDPNPNASAGALSANGQYRIPMDNPYSIRFATGMASVIPEVWAKGLRNPFRFSFDMPTAQLIAGDVGQDDIEEIDLIRKGGNYGWRVKEGTFLFDPRGCDIMGFQTDGRAFRESPGFPRFAQDPIAQYRHNEGTAIIAGYVYRGNAIPALRGKYVFGDYSKNDSKPRGVLFHLTSPVSQRGNEIEELGDRLDIFVLGFGQDAAGEIYVMGNVTGIPAGATGVVRKIVRAPRD
ncbi:PQQ-dependent sugar dehydrogenase [Massilia sp. SYSU DXS3249]